MLLHRVRKDFLIGETRIVLASFSKDGRIFANRGASAAGPSIIAFNRVNEVGTERQLHITGRVLSEEGFIQKLKRTGSIC
jgi:hypothetical protein